MKTFLFLTVLSLSLFGEMGDCMRCHPSLHNSKEHEGMKSCISCHSKSKAPTGATECGDKCFKCHTTEDMDIQNIPQHAVFEDCRECHVTKIHKMFEPSLLPDDQSHQDTLQELLQP